MPRVELPLPTATATIEAEIYDGSGNPPPNVIHENDTASVKATLGLDGVMFDAAALDWEFKLRIEGNPRPPKEPGVNVVLGPETKSHNGSPGNAPYTIDAEIQIPAGTLVVAPEKAMSYEFTLEVVAVDDTAGSPHGMAGFVDLGEVMVYAGP